MPEASEGFLDNCLPLAEWARKYLDASERTAYRYVNEADGLPVVRIGRRVLVHKPTADEWARRRMTQRNPVRKGGRR